MEDRVEGLTYRQFDPRGWPANTRGSATPAPTTNDCETCGGLGYVAVAPDAQPGEEGFGQMRHCPACLERQKAERVARGFERAGVPEKFRECSFDSYDLTLFPQSRIAGAGDVQRRSAELALIAVRRFASGSGPAFLTLLSPTGTGKTHLAIAAIRETVGREISALYLPSDELSDRARNFEDEERRDFFRFVQEVPVLVLDDVGAEHGSDFLTTIYHSIIDVRYRGGKKLRTLIISNLSEPDLTLRLGARVLDRLVEKGTGAAVLIDAESVRDRLNERRTND